MFFLFSFFLSRVPAFNDSISQHSATIIPPLLTKRGDIDRSSETKESVFQETREILKYMKGLRRPGWVLFLSRSTFADLLSPDYVEQIAEETVYGFSKLYSIPLLNPSRFYHGLFRLRSFYAEPRAAFSCSSRILESPFSIALLTRYYLRISTGIYYLDS